MDRWMGSILTGSAMSFPRHHPFVKMLLESAVQAYSDPETYAILGPSHMTIVARNFTGVENVLDITPEMGLNVVRWVDQGSCKVFNNLFFIGKTIFLALLLIGHLFYLILPCPGIAGNICLERRAQSTSLHHTLQNTFQKLTKMIRRAAHTPSWLRISALLP